MLPLHQRLKLLAILPQAPPRELHTRLRMRHHRPPPQPLLYIRQRIRIPRLNPINQRNVPAHQLNGHATPRDLQVLDDIERQLFRAIVVLSVGRVLRAPALEDVQVEVEAVRVDELEEREEVLELDDARVGTEARILVDPELDVGRVAGFAGAGGAEFVLELRGTVGGFEVVDGGEVGEG